MMEFFSFTFMLLLPLTTCRAVTSGQNPNVTYVMIHSQDTAQESSSSHPPSGISSPDNTQPTTIHENPTPPSLQTTPTAPPKTLPPKTLPPKTLPPKTLPPKTLPPNVPTTANKSQSSPQSNSTLGQETTPATTALTSRASTQTLTSAGPPTLGSSTQGQDSGQTSTPQIISNKTAPPSTHPPQTTDLISTSTTPSESKSPSPVPDGGAKVSTGSSRTTKVTTKAPLRTTKANRGPEPPTKRTGDSKAVAGIIGGALVLMMLGFLIIYLKKRKLRKQQITTSDWAGPSPFLEGGADSSQVELRANNRISLSSFLPQRLSKRLSLLQETEEEMEDLTPGSTFGDKTKDRSFGRETAGNGVKESNGTAGVKAEMNSTGESAESADTKTQNNDQLSTNNNLEDPKPSPELSTGPAPPADVENAPEQP